MSHQSNRQSFEALVLAILFVCLSPLAACSRPEAAKESAPAVPRITAAEAQPAAIQPVAKAEQKSETKPETRPSTSAESQPASSKRYPLTGRVVSVDKPSQSINVDGDEIPGFMAAMQMPYPVKDAAVLDKVTPGDRIRAEIVMGEEGAYLENVVVADNAPAKLHIK